MASKTLKRFKYQLDVYDYVHVQIFISIRSAGASPQIGEILQYCDFFSGWLIMLYFFLRHDSRSKLWTNFHGLWLIQCVFAQGRSFFEGCNNIWIHLG